MSLLTDEIMPSLEELRAYDSAVLEVASTENIDATAKLRLARKQIQIELAGLVERTCLAGIAVTDVLRQWHVFQALSMIYADAYYRQINDRYAGKLTMYRDLARRSAEDLFNAGIGIVEHPVGRAEAPQLITAPGPLAATTYYAAATLTNQAGQEGSPSEIGVVDAPDGHILLASMARTEASACGWNIYAGISADSITQQNDTPLQLTETWTEPVAGLRAGKKPGCGQQPSRYLTLHRILQRG